MSMGTRKTVDVKTQEEADNAVAAGNDLRISAGHDAGLCVGCRGDSQQRVECFGNSQPRVTCSDSSQPRVTCFGSSQPHVECSGNSQPRVTCSDSSQARVACFGSSQPRVVCSGNSQPRVTCSDSSQARVACFSDSHPRVECSGSSQPRVTCSGDSQPRVGCSGSSQPRVTCYSNSHPRVECSGSSQSCVECYDNSHPRVICSGDSQPHVTCFDGSQARVACHGSSQLQISGCARVAASGRAVVFSDGVADVVGGPLHHVRRAPSTPSGWAADHGLIIANGVVVLYKGVDDDYKSLRGACYSPGEVPEAADWDGGKAECGGGLHFSPSPLASLAFAPNALRFVACPVSLADCAVVDRPAYPDKIKARRCCGSCYEVDIDGKRIEPPEMMEQPDNGR